MYIATQVDAYDLLETGRIYLSIYLYIYIYVYYLSCGDRSHAYVCMYNTYVYVYMILWGQASALRCWIFTRKYAHNTNHTTVHTYIYTHAHTYTHTHTHTHTATHVDVYDLVGAGLCLAVLNLRVNMHTTSIILMYTHTYTHCNSPGCIWFCWGRSLRCGARVAS